MTYTEGNLHRLLILAILTAQSLVLFTIESFLPLPIPLPGAKLGLASLITLYVLYRSDSGSALLDALIIIMLRTLIAALLFGGPIIFLYSVSAGITSLFIMYLLQRARIFSIVGVSIAGGFTHNLIQLLLAALLIDANILWLYLPVLGSIGILAGLIIGFTGQSIFPRLAKYNLYK